MTNRTMELVNAHEFGAIIKEWADGTRLRPKTVAEFNNQVPKTAMLLGPGYRDEEVINYVDLALSSVAPNIVIPHTSDLNAPLPEGSWPLPSFYSRLAFGGKLPTIAEPEKFKLSRIADYSTGKCQ